MDRRDDNVRPEGTCLIYTWWLDTVLFGGRAHFGSMNESEKDSVKEFFDWMSENSFRCKWVQREVTFKSPPWWYEYAMSETQSGIQFTSWTDATEFKLLFSEVIVDGEES